MKGFSFLEIIISVLMATIVFVAMLSLSFQSLISADQSRDTYIATNLAAEGIEIVTNIRSNNWITLGRDIWRNGLDDGVFYIAQYDSNSLIIDSLNPYLYIDSNNSYCYVSINCIGLSKQSKFKRQIQISTISSDQMKIISTVNWEYNNNSRNVSVEKRLYNWR